MKRSILILVTVLLMAVFLCGCGNKEGNPPVEETEPVSSEETVPEGLDENEPEVVQGRVPDNIASKLESAVKCLLIAPAEFDNTSDLRDDTMIFAALLRYSSEFQPVEGDEYLSVLSLDKLPMAIHAVFGKDASLSSDYANGDYYPFEISVSENVIYRHGETIEDFYFYTSSVSEIGENLYEVQVLDLRDPLFFNEYENYLLDGNPATDQLVKDVKDYMMTYVFTVEQSDQGMAVKSLHIKNYKNLNQIENENYE